MPDVYIYEYKLLNKTRSTLIVIFIRSYVGLCIEFEKMPSYGNLPFWAEKTFTVTKYNDHRHKKEFECVVLSFRSSPVIGDHMLLNGIGAHRCYRNAVWNNSWLFCLRALNPPLSLFIMQLLVHPIF
ncbi:hypothetical protein HMPREF1622_00194 [Escherichia coli A35218R]|nr:hypothetical protein HMPREF1622_00194 [Escherichia coli A35218R]